MKNMYDSWFITGMEMEEFKKRQSSLRKKRASVKISPKRSEDDLREEFDQAIDDRVDSDWYVTALDRLMCLLL